MDSVRGCPGMCEEKNISCSLCPVKVSSHVEPSYWGDRGDFDHRYSQKVVDTWDIGYSLSGHSIPPSISPSIPIPGMPESNISVFLLVHV